MIDKILQQYAKRPQLYEKSTSAFWEDEHISKGMLEAHVKELSRLEGAIVEGFAGHRVGKNTYFPERQLLESHGVARQEKDAFLSEVQAR